MSRHHLLLAVLAFLYAHSPARAAGQQCHQQGQIRIYYYTDGPHAVQAVDANHNGLPDQVEDAMTQIIAARTLFVEALDFPDPFQSDRFRSASFLDVHFRDKGVLKSNGVAYDELQRFKRPSDPSGTLSLCFNVATSVKPSSNLTPAHEFFHLIQNGVTYFKNSWYAEGTARWSECGLGTGGLGPVQNPGIWPDTEEQKDALFRRGYDASEYFWNALARQYDDSGGELPPSPALSRVQCMRYVDGTPVLRDTQFIGHRFIRAVLLELGKVHELAFRELGYGGWSEANQTSSRNSPYILQAVRRVAEGWKTK